MCNRRISGMLALLALSLVPAGVSAQGSDESTGTAADRAAIAACLRESVSAPRACVGTIAVACIRQASGDRREAEIACARREASIWRERLDLGAAALLQRVPSGPRNRFAALQRSWEGYAAQKCAFLGQIQPPARAPALQAGCDLNEVAHRAIEIERLARGQTPVSQSPPQLLR
jgi:hypothetical protein